jgi:uncharacterized protein YbcI
MSPPPDPSPGHPDAIAPEPSGSVRTDLANAMVNVMKELYGRGPSGAKAWLLDDYVLIVMEGGLLRHEETLLAAGREDTVRTHRLAFQEAIRDTTTALVQRITGRRVVNYHSQIVFEPTRAFEMFVLEPEQG